MSILQLEASNIKLAARLWGNEWANCKVDIWCDNLAVVTGLKIPYSEVVVILYLEYLVQQGLKCCSIRNHVSVLMHYFAMYNWPIVALSGRKVSLLLKSVQVNARLFIWGFTSLSTLYRSYHDG